MIMNKMDKFMVRFMIIVLSYIFHKEMNNYIGIGANKLIKELEVELK